MQAFFHLLFLLCFFGEEFGKTKGYLNSYGAQGSQWAQDSFPSTSGQANAIGQSYSSGQSSAWSGGSQLSSPALENPLTTRAQYNQGLGGLTSGILTSNSALQSLGGTGSHPYYSTNSNVQASGIQALGSSQLPLATSMSQYGQTQRNPVATGSQLPYSSGQQNSEALGYQSLSKGQENGLGTGIKGFSPLDGSSLSSQPSQLSIPRWANGNQGYSPAQENVAGKTEANIPRWANDNHRYSSIQSQGQGSWGLGSQQQQHLNPISQTSQSLHQYIKGGGGSGRTPNGNSNAYNCPQGTTYNTRTRECTAATSTTGQITLPSAGCNIPSTLINETVGTGETDTSCVYDLTLEYITGSPDGVQKRIMGFNGQFPGPTLYCTRGKTMIVRLTNELDDNNPTGIHWHGIEQNNSPFFDGPDLVTQCPIIRNTTMIYKFQLFQAGTYWYHSHHSYQYVDGAWGLFVIHNTPEVYRRSYEAEAHITINDWHHLPAATLTATFLSKGNLPTPDSSLINGRGTFNCANVTAGQTCNPDLQVPAYVDVIRGRRYRFRILNSSARVAYNFSIDNHKLVCIETDGVDTVKVAPVDVVLIEPAQRYSFIVTANQSANEYWIRINGQALFFDNPATMEGRAILRYVSPPASMSVQSVLDDIQDDIDQIMGGRDIYPDILWDNITAEGGIIMPSASELDKYFPTSHFLVPGAAASADVSKQGLADIEHGKLKQCLTLPRTQPIAIRRAVLLDQVKCRPHRAGNARGDAPASYNRQIILNITDCPLPGSNGSRSCVNGNPYTPGETSSLPVLYQVINGLRAGASYNPVYTPVLHEVVQVVVNNDHAFPHPWHLHGHSFWVMGQGVTGAGHYNPNRDARKLTTKGVRRDTTVNMGNSWMVMRYTTGNPGTWFFHCHINWHLDSGLGAVFIEAQDVVMRVYGNVPKQARQTCRRVDVHV